MGVCQSREIQQARQRTRAVEKSLKSDAGATQKLLLLGPGESGKSTVLKQMIILHNNGFTMDELEERKHMIFCNTVTSMAAILSAMDGLQIQLTQGEEIQGQAKLIMGIIEAGKELQPLTDELVRAINNLWADVTVQKCYGRRNEFQLNDSAKYFIEAVDRISANDYCPSYQDMLHSRVATTGVVQVTFVAKGIEFRVFDVGGQRSERRKWIHCFDDVNAVTFVAAVSEYDQRLREDESANRLIESMTLFDYVCNSQFFTRTSLILFLNKTDLFRDKIKRVSLKVLFSDYTGGLNYTDGITFIKGKFKKLNEQKTRKLYTHETCATDTKQVQIVIHTIIDMVINENLKQSSMI